MLSNSELQLIQSYQDKCTDMVEKKLLSNVLKELEYRVPKERQYIGNNCPICNTHFEYSNVRFCWYCGQAIE